MRFTIIIPAYNAECYLGECLRSVTAQTFRDFEVVAVDDGSSDGTAAVLDAFAADNSAVKVLHGPNQGPFLARRRGLLHAVGKYVVFLDADDCLRPDALELVSRAIDETDADIVSFNYSRKADYSEPGKSAPLEPGLYSDGRYQLIREHICRGRFNNLCGKAIRLCRIDIHVTYGAFKGLMHGEDLFQLLPIVDECSSLVHLGDSLYFYRPNDASSTARYRPSQLADIVKVNRRLLNYADKWGGECPIFARTGEANQYFYLVKISELSDAGDADKAANFESICTAARMEGAFGRIHSVRLRPDNRVLAFAMERGWRGLARAVVLVVEAMKR